MRYLHFNHREHEVFLQTAEKEPGTHIEAKHRGKQPAEHHLPFRRACQLLPTFPSAFQRHSVFLCMLGLAVRVSQRGHKLPWGKRLHQLNYLLQGFNYVQGASLEYSTLGHLPHQSQKALHCILRYLTSALETFPSCAFAPSYELHSLSYLLHVWGSSPPNIRKKCFLFSDIHVAR